MPSMPTILATLLIPLASIYFIGFSGTRSFTEVLASVTGQIPLKSGATIRGFTHNLVAIGDLHGDIGNARKVLRMAGVTDDSNNWSGDIDTFVQTGDIVDRGDDTLALYMWMEDLRTQAIAAGDQTVSLLGNHELMNSIGDWRYVYPSEIKTFGGVEARLAAIGPNGALGKLWAGKNYTTAARVPLHPSIGPVNTDYPPKNKEKKSPLSHSSLAICHGGLAPEFPSLSPFPSNINDLSSSLLRKLQARNPTPPPHPPNPYPGLPHDATEAEERLYGSDGPLWYRGWAHGPAQDEQQLCKDVEVVLEKVGCRRMIMGHTPDFQKIVSRCGGRIIIIDTGISHAYGGALSALSIKYTLTPSNDDGSSWQETEVVTAIYPDHKIVLTEDVRQVTGEFASWH